jgi:uncharacterized protein (DUF2236 family)
VSTVLPSPDEYAELVPSRSSPVWRYASDIRMFASAGYALLLQVAHPTVGAGVMEYSNFREDPWGRLNRTLDYVHGTIYGGPEMAGEIGARVREMHKSIKGVKPDGERYHALEPEAYAWVHASLVHTILHSHRLFGRQISTREEEAFYADWLKLGRLIGVRERDLPATWSEFGAYFDDITHRALVDNPTVHMVLETLRQPAKPPVPIPDAVWKTVNGGATLSLITVGLLPPHLRRRLGLRWTHRDEGMFQAFCSVNRAATPLIHGPLKEFGPLYIRMRRKQLARGDVARGGPPVEEPSWVA